MMHLPAIIGTLSLGLSHVNSALLPPVVDALAQSMVAPEAIVRSFPDAEAFQGIRVDLEMSHRQVHEGMQQSILHLRPIDDKDHSFYLLDSLVGYHNSMQLTGNDAIRDGRMKLYRNAAYSSLVDLAKKYPEHAQEIFDTALQQMQVSLREQLLDRKMSTLEPMGKPEVINQLKTKITGAIEAFKKNHQPQINQLQQQVSKLEKSVSNFQGFEYSTVEEINRALKQTNIDGVPQALLLGDIHAAVHPSPASESKVAPSTTNAHSNLNPQANPAPRPARLAAAAA